ncbi:BON domain-containing protein [Chryseolinea sp. H1M3-3]|uniref:BON domain-containing protein n=1 Tax=Chryseolinea sp. H1M3-3 TaxID=3034144 RepID=UPI0023EB6BB4|nr:BON domain-containing protein [Chryseolinea sp. H1M3-3]
MRNRNNNRRGVLNTSNPDWREDRGSYGHGYQNHGYENDRSNFNYNEGNMGYGTSIGGRYDNYGTDRYYNQRGAYAENEYGRQSDRTRYIRNRDENSYNDWRPGSGNDYGKDYLNYGSERGANDRAYDEYNRSSYDRSNYEGRNYNRGGNFGGGSYGNDYNRNRRGEDRDDRGWWDKTTDEVSSWFGDEDAERRRMWDKQQEGLHKGKGPRGYSRSDERIKEDINDRLSDDVFVDATDIEVSVNQGEVILTGSVNDRSSKRRAEDIADGVSGVKNVENRIRVLTSQRTASTWSPSTDESSTQYGSDRSSKSERATSTERTTSKQTI